MIPNGVTIDIAKDNLVTVKGSKGQLTQQVDQDLILKIEEGNLHVERPTEQKRHKAAHGLYRTLISNMVKGVDQGYKKQLELVGVGYRAAIQGSVLTLTVGYSHNVLFALPPEVSGSVEAQKGKSPTISLECIDKQLLGQIAAKIRSVRPPDPYKGKGIKYSDEVIRRKAGKTAAK
jgi:large subunit ribosomal protein L6